MQRWQQATEAYEARCTGGARIEDSIALEPNFFWSHNNLADALFQLQSYKEAVEAYEARCTGGARIEDSIALEPNFFLVLQ